ncbi:loganic acid O-methyltransferase-like [Solanum dulcamara]|uniref:loganic acid O-methyltransferase-like n=1 Tax=Solanum dulcamara TaxID=45834 RepID=UPI002485E4FF|nr:loganic acid O-methyltransferase-like [Solanum dulcamara]
MPESLPMNGGNGIYSYSKNSQLQKEGSDVMMGMIKEAIIENMDIKSLLSNNSNIASFHIVDFGCSIGPNTFLAMQHIIEAITHKYQTQHKDIHISPEFQVFFNDHVTNDFNTLFKALPIERRYFASAVPGSFYGHLFPSRSIHFAYSSYSLQWLSKTPEELIDVKSRSWNKGKIHYIGASEDVTCAYVAQFEKDMEVFLNARAKEIVEDGMIVMILPGIHSELDHSQVVAGFNVLKFFESSLIDMINEGILEEALVDSFNVPLYVASPNDMTKVVNKSGYFSIEKIEIIESQLKILAEADAKSLIIHLRATLEGIFTKHFGAKISDEMFARTMDKCEEISSWMKVEYKKASQLFVVLKRK